MAAGTIAPLSLIFHTPHNPIMSLVRLPAFRHEVVLLSHTCALARLAKPRHAWHGMARRGMVWYGLAGQLGAGSLSSSHSSFGNHSNRTQEVWSPFW